MKGRSGKEKSGKSGWGGRGACWLSAVATTYPRPHFRTPSWGRSLLQTYAPTEHDSQRLHTRRLLQQTGAHPGLTHGPSLPQQDSEPSGAQRATSGENFQTPHQRTCQSGDISPALDYQPCTAPRGVPSHPSRPPHFHTHPSQPSAW